MPALEKWVLHRLSEITAEHEALVKNHDHKKIFSTLFNFCTVDLSAFYFDIRKDALYCDPLGSTRRRACRTVIYEVFLRLTTWLAPIMCFTMEEVWKARFPSEDGSVHLEVFRAAPSEWDNEEIFNAVNKLAVLRDEANMAIEQKRAEGVIKSSLEARVVGPIDPFIKSIVEDILAKDISDNNYANANDPLDTLADYLIVSEFVRDDGLPDIAHSFRIDALTGQSDYRKCERSWKYFKPTGDEDITPRDAAAVAEYDAK